MLDNVVSPPKLIDNPQSAEKQILKVFYKDNTFKSYNLLVDVQAVDVCSKFANKFLRISERAASHFSLHLVIQGRDVKQLQPTDRPIKIQKELSTLGYKFNTSENENYFLFCLSQETKSKMNDYCERNSVMLKDQRPQVGGAVSPQRGMVVRTQSVLAFLKPSEGTDTQRERSLTLRAKEKFSAIKKKIGKNNTVSEKTTPNQDDNKGSTSRQRGGSAPTQLSPQLQQTSSYPFTPQTPQSPTSLTTTPHSSTPQPISFQSPTSLHTTPQLSQHYPTTPLSTPTPTPTGEEVTVSPDVPRSLSQSWSPGPTHKPALSPHTPPPHDLPTPPSPKLFSPPSSPYRGESKTAEEDLETVIDSIFGNNNKLADEEDVGQMMDNLFDWYPTTSAGSTPTAKRATLSPTKQPLSPTRKTLSPTKLVALSPTLSTVQPPLDDEDDFNEILDALHQLSNV